MHHRGRCTSRCRCRTDTGPAASSAATASVSTSAKMTRPLVRPQILDQPPHQLRVVGFSEFFFFLGVAHSRSSSSSSNCLLVQLGVVAAVRQQFRVRALLDDAAVAQDDDLVGAAARWRRDGRSRIVVRWRMTVSRRAGCAPRFRVSTLAKASSRIRIFGSRITARASAVRCFWPPESVMPRSPTIVSYFCGKSLISPAMLATSAASTMRSRGRAGHAEGDIFAQRFAEQERVLRHEADRRGAALRAAIPDRAAIDQQSAGGASQSRAISAASVDLPLPVGPTMARIEPAGTCRLMSWSTGVAACLTVDRSSVAVAHGRIA